MKINEIKTIGIIGSGTMGRGIAISCSVSGFKTIVYDINDEVIKKAEIAVLKDLSKSVEKKKLTEDIKSVAISNLKFTSEMNDVSDCEFIIEAAPEDINLKKEIFEKLDSICGHDTILSTNTSSLSVTRISVFVKNNPERVVGMHFFNPAHIMKLTEVIKGDFTSDETVKTTSELSVKMAKVPVIAKDTPAFIVNRIARPFYGESLKILSEGTSGHTTIDKVMKSCGGFPMGPFELMDLIGIDINFSVTKSVYEAFFNDPKYRPSFIQKKMVDANITGRKTNRGFYSYDSSKK